MGEISYMAPERAGYRGAAAVSATSAHDYLELVPGALLQRHLRRPMRRLRPIDGSGHHVDAGHHAQTVGRTGQAGYPIPRSRFKPLEIWRVEGHRASA